MSEDSYPRLISLAVHELRTPASVVGGYLRMLQRDTEEPLSARHRKMVDEAEKSCARLVALISALSEVAKLDEGAVGMAARKTDLFALVADVAEGVQEAAEREVRLELHGPDAGAEMTGDEDRLKTAFTAIFHAILREKLGPCTVAVDRRLVTDTDHTAALIVVAETADVQAAYESPAGPFDEKRGGVGLSLPLARRVIEAHRGRLWSPAAADGAAGTAPDGHGARPRFDQRAARATALISIPLGS
jgi:signal transduction histidine kinase